MFDLITMSSEVTLHNSVNETIQPGLLEDQSSYAHQPSIIQQPLSPSQLTTSTSRVKVTLNVDVSEKDHIDTNATGLPAVFFMNLNFLLQQ